MQVRSHFSGHSEALATSGHALGSSHGHLACRFLLLALLSLSLCSCETAAPVAPGGRYIVNTTRAPFFKYGPAQSFGPDFNLIQGQRVTMIERAFGYSRVTTDEGVTGYVATDQIAIAPPEPFVARSATSGRMPTSFTSVPMRQTKGKPRRSSVAPTPSDPLFDVTDVPTPLPQEAAEPAPGFRF